MVIDSGFRALAKRKIADTNDEAQDESYSVLESTSSGGSDSEDSSSGSSKGSAAVAAPKRGFSLFGPQQGGGADGADLDSVAESGSGSSSGSNSVGSAVSSGSNSVGSAVSSRGSKRRRATTSDFMRNVDPSRSTQHVKIGGKYEELTNEEINTMKLDVLYRIGVLNQAGYTSPKEFSLEDSYTALEMEVNRLQTLETMSYGLQIMRWGLVNGVSLIEACNENFRLTPLKLKGWSTSVHRKSQTLDPILMELYQQWAYRFNVGPLTKLTCALLFSAVNVHMSNVIRDGADGQGQGQAQESGSDVFSNLMSTFGGMMGKGKGQQAEFRATPAPGNAAGGGGMDGGTGKGGDGGQQPTMRGPSSNFAAG